MPDTFRAFRIHRDNQGSIHAGLESLCLNDLSEGDTVIRVLWSSINYKDALAATGKGRILRRYPLNGGIDAAGVIESSSDPELKPGDPVLVHGHELSQTCDGGYSEYLRVPSEWVVPRPDGLTLRECMILGTAGFTAALALQQLELNGLTTNSGPVAISGATGGVGSCALDLLSGLGYETVAITRREEHRGYLESIGASAILMAADIEDGKRPMESARWAAAIDNVGGGLLSWLLRTTHPWGSVASIGMAGDTGLNMTVMPFILRGVNLIGITSAACPIELRRSVWKKLGLEWKPGRLEQILQRTVNLEQLPDECERMIAGRAQGRTIVKIGE